MQSMEKKQNSMLVSLDSLPKDILEKLRDYKFIQEEKKDDTEVEDCFRNPPCELSSKSRLIESPSTPRKTCDIPITPKSSLSESPSTPRSKHADDTVFTYPPQLQEYNDTYSASSPRKHLDRVSFSPHSEPDNCHLFGDNSDWMIPERLKPRSPPVSPDTSSKSSTCSSSIMEQQRLMVLNRSPESCFVRPPSSPRLDHYLQLPRVDRTPQKRCTSPRSRLEHQEYLERTPVKQVPILQAPPLQRRSMTGSAHKTESNSDQLSPYLRESINRSSPVRIIPDYPADYVDDRRGVRKQLMFDGQPRRQEDVYNQRNQYSPRYSPSSQRFDYEESDELAERLRDPESTALLSQILGELTKRKRKTSERSECDCGCEERTTKKRRTDLKRQMNLNYLKQLENDVSGLKTQLRRAELETRPENCSCAIMERQFLQMAENAYKNIRRHDTSADGFAQFRKELTETNQILKDSLTVLNNMKEFCEHKSMT